VVEPFASGVLVAAIDGLGHGAEAASAAQLTAGILEEDPHESVITLVQRCHQRLHLTRGVVMSLASFNAAAETMTWLGVGNVEGRLVRADPEATPSCEFLLLRGGTVGRQLPMLQATLLPVQPGDTLVLATDGVVLPSMEDLDWDGRPQAIAERILSKYSKQRDDALVLVARWVGLPR
jgi:serine phosphatase RsbU (regulator of sigma subunit)